ncbi:uncharacterized protein LOC124272755 [Haliotis rubra]|uniref:uncharacterized protein LOC124272755 n=1 Tax=Haliotis rubra TaxID=36100 RepID=UPI001EE56385|nr:uncharacterized protein LOC124272755 [Haliotis rubra]
MTTQALTQSQGDVRLHDFYKCVTQILQFSDEYYEEITRKAFSVVDVDGDGSITGADIYRLMLSLGEVISDDEILQILKSVDSDGDDRISFEDFQRFLTIEDDITNSSLDEDITDSNSHPERCNNIPFHARRKSLFLYRKLRAALAFLNTQNAVKPREAAPVKRQDTRTSSTNCKPQQVSPPIISKKRPEIKRLSVVEAVWVRTEDQSLVFSNSPTCNKQSNCLGFVTKEGNDQTQLSSHYHTLKSFRRKSDPYTTKIDGCLSKMSDGALTRVRRLSREVEQEPLFVRGRSSSTVHAIIHQIDDLGHLETSQKDNQDPGSDTRTSKQELLVNQSSDATAVGSLSPPRARKKKCLNVYINPNEVISSQNSSKDQDKPLVVSRRSVDMLPENYNDPSQFTASKDSVEPITCGSSPDQQFCVYGERKNMAGFRIASRHEHHLWKTLITTSNDDNLLRCAAPNSLSHRSYNSFSRRLERQKPFPSHRRNGEQHVNKASFLTLEFPAEKIHKPRYKRPSLLTQLPVGSHRRKNLPVFLG